MNSRKVDVLVVGAGIIGMTLANELQRAGREVTVIDKGEAGFGCSYGNAGWVTPCFAMPLPQPGMLLKSIGWLMNPDSPLYIKPQPSWLLVRWMTHFLSCMTEKKMRRSIGVLTDISKISLDAYRELDQKKPGTFGYDSKGLLMVSGTDDGMRGIELERKLMAEHGIPGVMLDKEAALKMEPALRDTILGGVHFTTEAHVEPLSTVQAYVQEFKEAGGQILPRTEVFDFILEGDRIDEVVTTRGRFKPTLVVLAMGSWSRNIGRRLGVSIPVLGGKGYSLIVDELDVKPTIPLMVLDRKLAVTPRADSVRLAGTLELVDGDEGITPRRVSAILNGAKTYLKMSKEPQVREVWRGLRPCTPDGVPMLGFSRKRTNLFYSLGHQMLGLQSAPGSAKLCTDLILGRKPVTDPAPFAPERFE